MSASDAFAERKTASTAGMRVAEWVSLASKRISERTSVPRLTATLPR
jgi:hypothetical protein